MSDELRTGKETAWRQLADIDTALEEGRITEQGWHAAVLAIVEANCLSADNPRAQSGHSGDKARWEQARRLLVDAIPGNCSFLDVGCADVARRCWDVLGNGHLMESLVNWIAEDGRTVEPYGVEISPALADLARRRPEWSHRIWTGNILAWRPPRKFDVVRTGLDYVPRNRRADLVEHVLHEVLVPGRSAGRRHLQRRTRSRHSREPGALMGPCHLRTHDPFAPES